MGSSAQAVLATILRQGWCEPFQVCVARTWTIIRARFYAGFSSLKESSLPVRVSARFPISRVSGAASC
jgi:hypothetical protein